MLNIKSITALALFTTVSLALMAEARTETQVDCSYTISQTWYGKCRVTFNQGGTIITTGNGHTIKIGHQGYLTLNRENRVTIDGSSSTAFWNAANCEFAAWKSNGSFSVNLYGRGVCL